VVRVAGVVRVVAVRVVVVAVRVVVVAVRVVVARAEEGWVEDWVVAVALEVAVGDPANTIAHGADTPWWAGSKHATNQKVSPITCHVAGLLPRFSHYLVFV
jgi:hypothetical protein